MKKYSYITFIMVLAGMACAQSFLPKLAHEPSLTDYQQGHLVKNNSKDLPKYVSDQVLFEVKLSDYDINKTFEKIR